MSLPFGRRIRRRFDAHVAAGRIVVDKADAERTAADSNPAARIQAAAAAEQSWNEPGRKVLWVDAAAIKNRNTAVGLAVVWKNDARPVGEQEWTELTQRSSSMRGAPVGEKEVLGVALDKGEELFAAGTVGDIVVYSDSSETLSSLLTVCPVSVGPSTKAVFRAIDLADRGFKVEFRLVRGHLSVLGNELANYWAREALALWPPVNTEAWAGWLMARDDILRRPVREQAWRMRLAREEEERRRAEREKEARMAAEEARLLEDLGFRNRDNFTQSAVRSRLHRRHRRRGPRAHHVNAPGLFFSALPPARERSNISLGDEAGNEEMRRAVGESPAGAGKRGNTSEWLALLRSAGD